MRKFKCWQSNAASPGIPERLKRKARHTENKKQKEKHLQPKLITQRPGHAPFSAQSGQQKKKKKKKIHINNPDAVKTLAEIGTDWQNGLKLN